MKGPVASLAPAERSLILAVDVRRRPDRTLRGWVAGLALLLVPFLVVSPGARGGTVRNTKHDFSSPGWTGSDEVCVFCHTPHFANTTLAFAAPLWNRHVDTTKTYLRYASSTMDTTPGNPTTTVSALCLGCHDGTLGTAVVNGFTGSDKHDLVNAGGPGGVPDTSSWPNCRNCHPDIYGDPSVTWIGTNLSNDHPVAMTYPTAAQDAGFNIPPDLATGWSTVKLYGGQVECASCHNPHDPDNRPFLRSTNAGSQLCLTCHRK